KKNSVLERNGKTFEKYKTINTIEDIVKTDPSNIRVGVSELI
ncbi:32530_t:CDS:1, partial [Gigaspora margarita]